MIIVRRFLQKFCRQLLIAVCCFVLISFIHPTKAEATARTWNGSVDSNWSTASNWTPSGAPVAADTLTFNAGSVNSIVDAGWTGTITSLTITSGYTGTITLARSLTLSSAFTQSGGSFVGASQTITTFAYSLSGGTFTSTSGTFTITGSINISGIGTVTTFDANGGTVALTGSVVGTFACGDAVFNLVTITKTSGAFMAINQDCHFPLGNNPNVRVPGGGGVTLAGTFSGTGTLAITSATTGTFALTSTGSISGFTGLNTLGLSVTGTSLDISAYTTFSLNGDLTVAGGELYLPAATGTFTVGAFTISGTSIFKASPSNMNITGVFSITGSTTFDANDGTITLTVGGSTMSCNNVTFNLVVISKTTGGAQTISSNCSLPLGNNPTVRTANGSNLILQGELKGTGTLTYIAGTLAKLEISSTSQITGFTGFSTQGLIVTGAVLDLRSYTTFSLNGDLTVAGAELYLPAATGTFSVGAFTISGTSTFYASPSNMNVSTSFSITGTTTFDAQGGRVTFISSIPSATCNSVTFANVSIAKSGGAAFTVGANCTFPMGNNPTMSASNGTVITVDGELTGSGTLTYGGSATGLVLSTSGRVSGFSGLNLVSLTVQGGTKDFSSYTTMSGTIVLSGGTLTLPAGMSITTLTQSNGTLSFSAGNFTVTGVFTLSGGVFTAPSGTFSIAGNLAVSGSPTFNANGGVVNLTGTAAQTLSCSNTGGLTFPSVTVSKTGGSVTTSCGLTLSANPTFPVALTVSSGGSIIGTGTFTISGALTLSSTTSMSGFTGLTESAASTTLTISGYTADFSSFSTFSLPSTTSVTVSSGSLSFPAIEIYLANISVTGGTLNAPASVSLHVGGNFSVSSGTFNHNNGTLDVDGTSNNQTFTCTSTTYFNLVTINKLGNGGYVIVNANCNLPLGNNPTISLGETGSGSLAISYGTISGTGTLTVLRTYNNGTDVLYIGPTGALSGFTGLDIPVTGTLDIANSSDFSNYTSFPAFYSISVTSTGNLKLPPNVTTAGISVAAGGKLTGPSNNLTLSGYINFYSGVTFDQNGGTLTLTGSNAQTLDCVSGNYFPKVAIAKTGGGLTLSGCSANVGSNPVIPGPLTIQWNSVISGTGTLTVNGAINITYSALIQGFSGLTGTGDSLSISSPNGTAYPADYANYSPFNVTNLTVSTGETINLPPGANISGTFTLNGGTLTTTTGDIIVGGGITFSSGIFNAPTGILSVGGALNFSGTNTFNHNNGTLNFTGGAVSHSCNSKTFNAVTFNNTAQQSVASNCIFNLGTNPTIANGISNSGTLTGSGTVTMTTGTLTLNTGSTFTGFTGLTGTTNGLSVAGTYNADWSAYSPVNIGGNFTLAGTAIFTAPSGVMNVGGNFTHTAGTFNHNNSTVVLNGTGSGQTITGTTTFYNLTKQLTSASAQTLTFPSTLTQTVSGALTLKGYDTTARLLLRSSSNGTQWKISPTGTRDILYLDVKDGNNTSGTSIQMGGTGSVDSTNNTYFNFGSLTPNDPTTLGPAGVISNVYTTTLQPLLSFLISDPNPLDTVKYQIQVSTVADFANTVIDYVSALISQGTKTFTVGQSAGTGTYITGSINQLLSTASYYWRVRTTDSNGLVSNYTTANNGSVAFLVDANPPDAFTPTLNVTSPTTNTQPIVTFSTTDNVAVDHYQVKVDSGSFVTQVSPYQLSTLSNGSHTITVRAYDTTGNYTDGSVNIALDASPPAAFTPTLNVTSPTSNTTPSVSFVTTDDNGIDHYEVKVDSGSFSTQVSPYQVPTLSNGSHTITVRAYDQTSHYTDGLVSLTVDLVSPQTFTPTLNTSSPTNNHSPIVSFYTTDANGINHYEVSIDGGSFTTKTSPYQLPTLTADTHTVTVRAFDTVGNTRDGSITFVVTDADITVPNTFTPTLNTSGSYTTNQTPSVSFVATDNIAIDHYDVKVDSGAFSTQVSPYQLPTLSEGAHTITVRAFDTSSNTRDGTVSVTVDLTIPDSFAPSFATTSPTNDTTPPLAFWTSDNVGIQRYEVSVENGAYSAHSSPYDLPTLDDGTHTAKVRAYDLAGNYRDSSIATIVIDTVAPVAFTPSLNVTSPTIDTAPIVSFSTTDNIAMSSYQVKVDAGSYTTRTSPYQLPVLSNGSHTVSVKALDTAGNSTEESLTFIVDIGAPAAFTPTLDVSSPTNNTQPTVSFSTTDGTGIDHYEVKIDNGSFTRQSSPYKLPVLSDGRHTVIVRAFDVTNNTTDGSVSVTIDTTGPTISISAPKKISNVDIINTTVFITDSSGVSKSTVTRTGGVLNCTQQTSTTVSCTATISSSGTLTISAIDNASNTTTQAMTGYVIETTVPVITITAPTKTSGSTITNTTLSVSDNYAILASNVTAVSGGSISCMQTSTTIVDCTATVSSSGDLVINAWDAAGNPAAVTEAGYTVSSTAPASFTPTLNVASLTTNTRPILSFSTTDSDGIDHYEVKIDSGAFSIHTSPYQLPTLSNGFHTFIVRAYDTQGNFSDGSVTVTVNTDPPAAFTPTLDVTSPTSNTRPYTSFITTDDNGIDHYEVKIDSGTLSTQVSPYHLPTLAEGVHTITVRAYDLIGNTTDGTVSVTIDTTSPQAFTPTLDVVSPTNDETPTVSFSTTDTSGIDYYQLQVDSGSFVTQSSPYGLPTLAEGTHTLTVRAFDLAGNYRDGSTSVVVDITPPATFTPTLNVTSPTTNSTPTLSFATTDNVAISEYKIQIDSGSLVAHTSPYMLPTLADGTHTIVVFAYDTAGNGRQETLDLTVDTSSVVPSPQPSPTSQSSGGGDTSSVTAPTPVAPGCGDTAPGSAPTLYGGNALDSDSILLSFSEATDPVAYYALTYGTESGNYLYGLPSMGDENVRSYLVGSLAPNTTYYFRIRAGNGCATGAWSNEIAVKTKSIISFRQLELTTVQQPVATPTPQPVVEATPTPTPKEPEVTPQPSPQPSAESKVEVVPVEVKIQVLDTNGKPVKGAKVTIHSKVQVAITDENGYAHFEQVDSGSHKVIVEYQGFQGEQALTLDNTQPQVNFKVTVEPKYVLFTPFVIGVIIAIGVVFATMLVVIVALYVKLSRIKRLHNSMYDQSK